MTAFTPKLIKYYGPAAALAVCLSATSALAVPIVCTSTLSLGPTGDGYELDSALTAGVCVQTADAIFGNFNLSALPTGGRVAFNVTNFGTPSVGYHGISFNDNFSAAMSYMTSYSVEISSGTALFNDLDADFTQTNGTSSLVTTTTQAGTGSIDWTKVGASGSGPDLITYNPNVTRLNITNTLTDNGAISAITNNVVEDQAVAVMEPGSAVVLISGMAGLVLLRQRQQRRVAHA